MKMAEDDDYVNYYWPDYSIFDREGGLKWAQDHCVINPQGKVIGFVGGFNSDFASDVVFSWSDGQTGMGWHKPGTNVCYKHKTKKEKYIDSFGTTANFWDVVVTKVNSDFEVNVNDVKNMFGVKQISDKFFDTIKDFAKKNLGGNLGDYTQDVIGIFKNMMSGSGEDIVEIIKAGVASYNARPENKEKQIVWDGEHIKIGDLFVSLVGYLYAAVEIITVAIIMNFINELKKKKDEAIQSWQDAHDDRNYQHINVKDEAYYQKYEKHAPSLVTQSDLSSQALMTNLQSNLGLLKWEDVK